MVATTLTQIENAAPAGVATVVPILPPGIFYCIPNFPPLLFCVRILNRILSATATLAHKEEHTEQNTNEADGEVHDFRYKLMTCENPKSPMLQENNPDAACMYVPNKSKESGE